MRTVISVRCKDQTLSYIKMPLVTSGNINEDKIRFEFCPMWDGFTKTAIFYRNEADVYHVLLEEDNSCFIPPEVLTTPGVLYFGVFGALDDRVRTSEVIQYTVKRGAITEATKISDPTPDIYAQILAALGNKVNKTDLSAVATSGSYNDLIDKPAIPSIEGLATEKYVDNAIKNIDIPEVDVEIPDGSITTGKLEDNSVTNEKIADGAITGDKIADGAIDTKQIADNSIDGYHIKENTIGDGHIYPWSILTDKIADKAVTPEKLDRAYATEEYVDNAVENIDFPEIEPVVPDGSISTEKLLDKAVTPEKLDRSYATEEFVDNAIKSINLPETDLEVADNSIGTQKLKDGAVTPDKLSEKYLKDDTVIPTALSELTDDSTHRLVTDEEKAELEKIASAFNFNVNLFDKSTATVGSYINNTTIEALDIYYVSDYVEVKPSTYYIVPSTVSNLGSNFDENKHFMGKILRADISQPHDDKSLIFVDEKTKYIRVNGFSGPGTAGVLCSINDFMIVEGTEYPESYIPYNGLKPVIKSECIADDEESTNTEDIEKVIGAFDFNVNLFDKSKAEIGYLMSKENVSQNSSYYLSDYIEVKPSTYYIVSCTASQVGSYFDENKNYLGQFKRSYYSQPYSDKTVIFTSATTKYIRVHGFSAVGTASVTCPITEYMVIEGQTYPENYIPYNGLKPIIKSECVADDKDFLSEINRSNILYGKTLMTIGDSITAGLIVGTNEETGYAMTYGGLTAYRNNMTFINTGWSGGTIANDNVKPFISNGDIYVALGDIIPDYLTVWYGWNDYAREAITLGDINSTDETTYYGAWNIALNLLIQRYPTTKIGVVVPYGMNTEWRQAVRDVAKKWGVPYLDLYENQSCIFDNESGIEPSIAALRKSTFLADGCHPNSAGYEWLSTMYEAFLRRL